MLVFLLIVFAACVLTVLFWTAVVAAALAIAAFLLLILQGAWWLITRPIVWFIIWPIKLIFGIKHDEPANETPPASKDLTLARIPTISAPNLLPSMTDKVEQLGKLKSLLEGGAINQEDFNKMKAEVLAS